MSEEPPPPKRRPKAKDAATGEPKPKRKYVKRGLNRTVDSTGLNMRQRRFITIYHEQAEKNAAQAAAAAGYDAKNAAQTACVILKNPNAKALLAKLEKASAEAAAITRDSVMADIARQKEGAENDGQWGAAIRASELQGKALRIFDDPKSIPIQEAVAMLTRIVSLLVPLIADDRHAEAQGLVQSVLGEVEKAA